MVFGLQYLCRKKRNENEDEPQAAHANPTFDEQVDPTTSAEAVYDELDLKKLNKEENAYQHYPSKL